MFERGSYTTHSISLYMDLLHTTCLKLSSLSEYVLGRSQQFSYLCISLTHRSIQRISIKFDIEVPNKTYHPVRVLNSVQVGSIYGLHFNHFKSISSISSKEAQYKECRGKCHRVIPAALPDTYCRTAYITIEIHRIYLHSLTATEEPAIELCLQVQDSKTHRTSSSVQLFTVTESIPDFIQQNLNTIAYFYWRLIYIYKIFVTQVLIDWLSD